jgi:V-type H+-transporting ATPase subunit C
MLFGFARLINKLKGSFVDYLEPLKQAFREKRFIVRELTYDSARAGGVDSVIEQAKNELKQAKATTLRWCKAHFGEVYSGFVHLKVIQAFVESVLRYGLPADFCSLFMKPDTKREKEQLTQLCTTVLNLKPELRPKKGLTDEDEEDKDNESNLPFVLLKCPIIGNNQVD